MGELNRQLYGHLLEPSTLKGPRFIGALMNAEAAAVAVELNEQAAK